MDREIQKVREAIAGRGDYLYYIYKQMEKEGIEDRKGILARAIHDWGDARAAAAPVGKPCDFVSKLELGNHPDVYERKIVSSDEKEGIVEMGFCPLVNAWRESGATDEEIVTLCDIACEGDYAIVGEKLKLTFDQRLSCGADCCRMRIVPRY